MRQQNRKLLQKTKKRIKASGELMMKMKTDKVYVQIKPLKKELNEAI